jgi:hypothetical protein
MTPGAEPSFSLVQPINNSHLPNIVAGLEENDSPRHERQYA